ncbi:MAG: hypothetical protein HZC14_00005, partial [Candidatus Niyogibacteria bacterium]|nr:hypothetical protein [Candidatus Niyogibacteria bacterium]
MRLKGGNVGIGTVSPEAKLEIAGQIKITGGSPGANKVLTSDSTGLATWQTPTAFSETDPKVGSLTTNYVPKWNGTALANGTIFDNGNVGIGTVSPESKLNVVGSIRANRSDASADYTRIDYDGIYSTGTNLYVLSPAGYDTV